MSAAAVGPVRLDFDDYITYTETHRDDAFELLDGPIYGLAPDCGPHARTRSAIQMYLLQSLDLHRFTPYTEISFRAPDWADGPDPTTS